MPPRLNPWGACRSFALRSRPQVQSQQPSIATAFARHLASQPPNSNTPTGNGRSIPPIPPSMLPPGESPSDEQDASSMTEQGEQSQLSSPEDAATPWRKQHKIAGLKFEAPPMPMAKLREAQYHMKYRYDEGIAQITRLLMRHGKLSKAQNVSYTFLSPPQTPFGPVTHNSLGHGHGSQLPSNNPAAQSEPRTAPCGRLATTGTPPSEPKPLHDGRHRLGGTVDPYPGLYRSCRWWQAARDSAAAGKAGETTDSVYVDHGSGEQKAVIGQW